MDLVYRKVPAVTMADGTGLYPSERVQLYMRCRHRSVVAGCTGRRDREGLNGLQYRFMRVDEMMLGRLHIRSQDTSIWDQEFGTISCSIGDVTLLTVTEVSWKQEFLYIRCRAIGGKEEIRFCQVRPPVDFVNQHLKIDREGLSGRASSRGRLPSEAIKGGIVAQHTVFCRVSNAPVDREIL